MYEPRGQGEVVQQTCIVSLPRKPPDVGGDPLTVALHDALCRGSQHEPPAFVKCGRHLLGHHEARFSVLNAADAEALDADPVDRLVALALAYARFAHDHTPAWRGLFEHRMAPDSVLPEFAVADQMRLFDRILDPVKRLMPEASD